MIKFIALLGLLFCSTSIAQIDIDYSRAGVSSPNWRDPVADVGSLPTLDNNLGDVRVTNDDQSIYVWDGSNWQSAGGGGGGGGVTSINGQTGVVVLTTDEVSEGATNLYLTAERVQDIVASELVAGSNITLTYNDALGQLTIAAAASGITTIEDGVTTTTGFGANEIIFSDGSVTRGNSKFTYNPTNNLFQVTDGSDRFLKVDINNESFGIGDLDGAGTYIELSTTPNLIQFVADRYEFAGNQYIFPSVQGTADQYLAVDSVSLGLATLEWRTLPTAPVASVNGQTGTVVLTTTDIAEGTNLYYTDERVDDRVSNLLVAGSGIDLTYNDAGNSLTIAVDGSITSGLLYKGLWNSNSNTPTLASGTGTTGFFYIVDTAGTTTLDGISSWAVGDQLFFNGTVWQKIAASALPAIANGTSVTTGFNAGQVIFSDGTNTVGTDKFLYDDATDQLSLSDGSDEYFRSSPTEFAVLDFAGSLGTGAFRVTTTRLSYLADVATAGQGTLFTINSGAQTVVFGDIDALDGNAYAALDYTNAAPFFVLDRGGFRTFLSTLDRHDVSLGDIDGESNSVIFEVNNSNNYIRGTINNRQVLNLDQANELYQIGRISGGNTTRISIDDTAETITLDSVNLEIGGVTYEVPTVAPTNGQVLTAGASNVLSWQNPASGFADPMTSAGDIIIRNGSNVTSRLGIGSSGQVLTVSGGVPVWAAAAGGGITSLNSLTAGTQTFATGTGGSDFNISSSTSTHTFNIPDAGTSARGLVTTGAQAMAGAKAFSGTVNVGTSSTTPATGAAFSVISTTGFLAIPNMTTAQKTAIASGFPQAGSLVFDTSLGVAQFWTGSTWNSFGLATTSPVSGAGANQILYTNSSSQLAASSLFKWDSLAGSMGINFSAPGGSGIVVLPAVTTDTNLRLTLITSQTGDRIQLRNADNFTTTGRMTVGGLWQLPTGAVSTPTYSFEGDANTGFYRTGADAVAISTNGANRMTATNNGVGVTNLLGISSAPTVAAGTGAGTTPTIALSSETNLSGVLTLTTGTTPAASATVATITFNGTLASAPECHIQAFDDDAAALSGTSAVYVSATSTTTMTISVLSTNLAAATQYVWTYQCMQ